MRESIEANIIFKPRKRHKFGAIKTTLDGIQFDSKSEAAYYSQLKLLKYGKQIKDFECQPKFEIAPAYIHPTTGKKVSAKYYIADFKVILLDGSVEIIDVKSGPTKTDLYSLKKHLFESRYHLPIKEVDGSGQSINRNRKTAPRKRNAAPKTKLDQR